MFSTGLKRIKGDIQKSPVDDKNCFIITNDDDKSISLCAMKGDLSDSGENIRDEWVKQIYNFRDNCHETLKVKYFDDEVSQILQRDIDINQLEGENNVMMNRRRQKSSS